jgi:two-component system, response regulator PdtaR
MNAVRIAIADDERDIRDFLCRLLPYLGHEVVCVAQNGRQLADECIASPPDLIITDVRMPELDGISAAAEVLQHYPVPVIVLSAGNIEGEIPALRDAPAVVQLVKPINRRDLQQAIERAMALQAAGDC